MLRLVVIVFVALLAIVNCQMDTSKCDPKRLKPHPNIPDREFKLVKDEDLQYHMAIEDNDGSKQRTFEMDQYYDGPGNRAVTFFKSNSLEVRIYVYGNTNERVTHIPKIQICTAEAANGTFDTPISAINTPSGVRIMPPISLLHLMNGDAFKLVYIGKDNLRGIPVDQWQACTYSKETKVTSKLTVSLADGDSWTVAEVLNDVKNIPVGMQAENFLPNGTTWKNVYTVTKFKAAAMAKEEIWTVADGVYCDGRQKGKALPNVPKAFSYRSQVVQPITETKNLIGSFTNIKEIYNQDQGLFRIDYIDGVDPITEVHDFNTDLNYKYNRYTGDCALSTIDPAGHDAKQDGGFVKMKDPKEFFYFDTADFQYVGQKLVGNINTDVWIGKRDFENQQTTWQWHFMADGWFQNSKLAVLAHEPVMLIITFFERVYDNVTNESRIQTIPVYYYYYDFEETPLLDSSDFDIVPCFDDKPKKRFSFNLPTQHRARMQKYKTNLKNGILLGLVTATSVLPLRIQRLEVEFYQDSIQVVFTMLEKPEFYGPIKTKPQEITIANATLLLNATLNAGSLVIPFIIDNNEMYSLLGEPNTLRELNQRPDIPSTNKHNSDDSIMKPNTPKELNQTSSIPSTKKNVSDERVTSVIRKFNNIKISETRTISLGFD